MAFSCDAAGILDVSDGMEDDYGLMLLPKGPQVDENVIAGQHNTISLPITVQRPEAKVELANALFKLTDDYRDMDGYIDELIEEEWAMFLRDRESMEILEEMFANWKLVSEFNYHVPQDELAPRAQDIAQGEISPIAALNELEPIVQTLFDEIYK